MVFAPLVRYLLKLEMDNSKGIPKAQFELFDNGGKAGTSPYRTQRSHSAKKVAGGKGDGADNAPIPIPLVTHEMRENGS